MIPYELEKDKHGLLYYKEDDILRRTALIIDRRNNLEDRYYQNYFYPLMSTDEYVIKYSSTFFTRKEIKKIKEMLINLLEKQKDVSSVDFPIAYFMQFKRLAGLIVRYYQNSISCDNIMKYNDLNALGKYYFHDDDNVHNLFLLYFDVLNIIEELFDNDIYYTDINPGNIVIDNNQVRLIDFDYRFVLFDKKDTRLQSIMYGFFFFLRETLRAFELNNSINIDFNNFDEARTFVKKIENKTRKG